ncbi:MAG: hypothetical protein K2I42_07065 [Anaeroplasmataceae bacterium]|nr:hypothetical protein [Anaeroplasmataceae bacterium]
MEGYYKENDNELIYLIKDGSNAARKVLYEKYTYLIKKFYFTYFSSAKILFTDFLQEGLMLLERSIYCYRSEVSTFYSFYSVSLRNLSFKFLSRTKSAVYLRENPQHYINNQDYIDENSKSYLFKVIQKEFEKEEEILKVILDFCIIENGTLSALSKKLNISYNKLYIKYKKAKEKVEKILTNLKG